VVEALKEVELVDRSGEIGCNNPEPGVYNRCMAMVRAALLAAGVKL